jgi:hypothetical protein
MDVPPAEGPLVPSAGAAPEASVTPAGTQGIAITPAASDPSRPTSDTGPNDHST